MSELIQIITKLKAVKVEPKFYAIALMSHNSMGSIRNQLCVGAFYTLEEAIKAAKKEIADKGDNPEMWQVATYRSMNIKDAISTISELEFRTLNEDSEKAKLMRDIIDRKDERFTKAYD
jgi:hypothetical protein